MRPWESRTHKIVVGLTRLPWFATVAYAVVSSMSRTSFDPSAIDGPMRDRSASVLIPIRSANVTVASTPAATCVRTAGTFSELASAVLRLTGPRKARS